MVNQVTSVIVAEVEEPIVIIREHKDKLTIQNKVIKHLQTEIFA